jgi:catechol 2,3-dioxygenase-like lactoylglutathione lyase family enzyme
VPVLCSYPCLCVPDVDRSSSYLCDLLGVVVTADAGWYVELASPEDRDRILLALCAADHPSVAAAGPGPPSGMLVSVVVTDVDAVAARVPAARGEIVASCRDEEFGQRHFLLRDPDGILFDVIERIRPSAAFLRVLAARRRGRR